MVCKLSHEFLNHKCYLLHSIFIEEISYYLASIAVYGAQPAFVLSTATSANPCEHAMVMTSSN